MLRVNLFNQSSYKASYTLLVKQWTHQLQNADLTSFANHKLHW